MAETALLAPENHYTEATEVDVGALRGALRARRKVHFRYRDLKDRTTERSVRPLALSFYGPIWLLSGWCELRQDFRSFRLDRVAGLEVLDETFRPELWEIVLEIRFVKDTALDEGALFGELRDVHGAERISLLAPQLALPL